MLEQLLKKFFESDSTAIPESESKINAEVLSLIEREKPMKKFRIKPLIIAAAVTAVGLMSVVLSVDASVDNTSKATEGSIISIGPFWNDKVKELNLKEFEGNEEGFKLIEENYRALDIANEYFTGKAEENLGNEKITVEKELDDRDFVGYAEPCKVFSFSYLSYDKNHEKALEFIKRLEDDPEELGLIPIGKSETFEGGLRIVNRHFENTNEPVDGWKKYYSLRRVYTDDAENRLLASIYLGGRISFPDCEGTLESEKELKQMTDYQK